MSVPSIVRDLVVAHTRALKLPGVARTFEGLARQARDAHWPHEDYLHEVLSAEQASRHESVLRQRLRVLHSRQPPGLLALQQARIRPTLNPLADQPIPHFARLTVRTRVYI